MSKKTNAPTGISWGKASAELQAKVKFVLQSAQNNRYSVSRIYAAHNAIFELSEAPQTCSTCLTSRVSRLRKWWGENAPKDETKKVPTTGEAHEATSYEGVVDKYKIKFPQGEDADEAEVLNNFLTAGVGAKEGLTGGITANELALLKGRLDELDGKALTNFYAAHEAKLAELGVTSESSDEDTLEALEVLRAAEDATPEEIAHYDVQIPFLQERIAAANVVEFIPAGEGAAYGNGYKGGQPLPEGVYEHEGKRYQVSGDLGGYTELSDDEQGHDPKAPQTHYFGADDMAMIFTPNADDVTKGAVAWTDGSKVKAGTYVSATGVNIAVQVGSKASIK